jgi:hypothetical protein
LCSVCLSNLTRITMLKYLHVSSYNMKSTFTRTYCTDGLNFTFQWGLNKKITFELYENEKENVHIFSHTWETWLRLAQHVEGLT